MHDNQVEASGNCVLPEKVSGTRRHSNGLKLLCSFLCALCASAVSFPWKTAIRDYAIGPGTRVTLSNMSRQRLGQHFLSNEGWREQIAEAICAQSPVAQIGRAHV